MSAQHPSAESRAALLQRLFPQGVPSLWCPLLTHYHANGSIDGPRIVAHLRHLAPNVKGFLIPGSTGDGWELSDQEYKQLLGIALHCIADLELHLLIGILKPDIKDVQPAIDEIVRILKARTGESDPIPAMARARVRGFTVCPARGKDLTQSEIEQGLAAVLETGFPIAIYRLPQVTQNEISPEVASALAQQFQNFVMLKDTSGKDRIALSGKDLGGVFTVRGAESDYARWPAQAGGPYQGFLLSTANCFGLQLRQLLEHISAGRSDQATQLSQTLTSVIGEAFRLASPFPHGNPFANANKAMDHFFAHGPQAVSVPPPRVHAGVALPLELIRATGALLRQHSLMPAHGYL